MFKSEMLWKLKNSKIVKGDKKLYQHKLFKMQMKDNPSRQFFHLPLCSYPKAKLKHPSSSFELEKMADSC